MCQTVVGKAKSVVQIRNRKLEKCRQDLVVEKSEKCRQDQKLKLELEL